MKLRPGRPKKADAERLDTTVQARVTSAERAEIEQSAGTEPVGIWLRREALRAARRKRR